VRKLVTKTSGGALDTFPRKMLKKVTNVFDNKELRACLFDAPHVLLPQSVTFIACNGWLSMGLFAEPAKTLAWRPADYDISLGKNFDLSDIPTDDVFSEIQSISLDGMPVRVDREYGPKSGLTKAKRHAASPAEQVDKAWPLALSCFCFGFVPLSHVSFHSSSIQRIRHK
jgi:hypothetical protein